MKPPRCKDVIKGMRLGDSVVVSESRGESLRWAAWQIGCVVKTKRQSVGSGGKVRVTLVETDNGERAAA